MRTLKCVVEPCIYNRDRHCGATEIKVMGNNAAQSGETLCSTFMNRSDPYAIAMMQNAQFKSGITQLTNNEKMSPRLYCSVSNCNFNNGRYCEADAVEIEGDFARNNEATSCATFSIKQG